MNQRRNNDERIESRPSLARWRQSLLGAVLVALLAGCQSMAPQTLEEAEPVAATAPQDLATPTWTRQPERADPGPEAADEGTGPIPPSMETTVGNRRFFKTPQDAKAPAEAAGEGEVTLNFENANIQEVAHFVLGRLLNVNYLIHPQVAGAVTLQTSRPLATEATLEMLEDLLRLNGATLVVGEDDVYRVLPRQGALRGTTVPGTEIQGAGLRVLIAPLEFISAQEMVKILEPFLTPEALVRADPVRNLLMLSGTGRELSQWQDTIDIFDVDWLKGMSVGVFRLSNAKVGEVIGDLEKITSMGTDSPLGGLFHFMPIERLNTLLVMTPQPRYLDQAREWVERLDAGQDMLRTRLFVYRMKHVKATEVADLLTQVFASDSTKPPGAPRAELAPGVQPASVASKPQEGTETAQATAARATARPKMVSATLTGSDAGTGNLAGEVKIIADDTNNALLIHASEPDYRIVRQALDELDIPRLQVLVDATILEVSLTDELRYGLQWYFTNKLGDYQGQGIFGQTADLARVFPGFNYSIVDSASQVRAVLSALAEDSLVNVLSSPSIMVMNNEEALIRVGDQVPIRTQESTSTVTDNPVTVTSIDYRDTGVTLRVTPRVNAGGMVQVEVEQEVTDVSTTTTSDIDSPTLLQRLIQTSVAVQSGETIVLGGLMRETNNKDQSGLPVLHKLPVLGPLFGTTASSVRRTELLVLLTPRVAHDSAEARAITEAFRLRMQSLEKQVRGSQVKP